MKRVRADGDTISLVTQPYRQSFPSRTPPPTSSASLPTRLSCDRGAARSTPRSRGQPAGPAFNADIGAELDQAFCLQRLLQLWTRGTRGVSAEFTETRRCPRGLHTGRLYIRPMLHTVSVREQQGNFPVRQDGIRTKSRNERRRRGNPEARVPIRVRR